jgi:hypothetical protein
MRQRPVRPSMRRMHGRDTGTTRLEADTTYGTTPSGKQPFDNG